MPSPDGGRRVAVKGGSEPLRTPLTATLRPPIRDSRASTPPGPARATPIGVQRQGQEQRQRQEQRQMAASAFSLSRRRSASPVDTARRPRHPPPDSRSPSPDPRRPIPGVEAESASGMVSATATRSAGFQPARTRSSARTATEGSVSVSDQRAAESIYKAEGHRTAAPAPVPRPPTPAARRPLPDARASTTADPLPAAGWKPALRSPTQPRRRGSARSSPQIIQARRSPRRITSSGTATPRASRARHTGPPVTPPGSRVAAGAVLDLAPACRAGETRLERAQRQSLATPAVSRTPEARGRTSRRA